MSDTSTAQAAATPRSRVRTLFIAAFLLFLWLPTIDVLLCHDDVPQVNEKRRLAEFPTFATGLSGIRHFISGLETYYNDHFGFRKRMIYWGQRWRLCWFNESPGVNVIVGKDGWLYYHGDNTLADIRRTSSFTPKQLEAWKSLLEKRRDWLAKRGIHYAFVVPPDKHNVYPEYLPDWIKTVGTASRLDQFMAYMKTNSTVPVVDLRQPLLQAKKANPIYLSTDTHWNQYGAFIGYQELIRSLSAQIPEINPLPITAFSVTTNSQSGGDLAVLLAQTQTAEKFAVHVSPSPSLPPVSLQKNSVGTTLSSTNSNATGKALVFRDSFSEAWAPFIGYHFNQVTYYWRYTWDAPLIEKEKPNIVIDEILERYLYQQNPADLGFKDA